MKKIGIFTSSKYFKQMFREMYYDLDESSVVHHSQKIIVAPETLYTFHTIDGMQDVEYLAGRTFDFVQIHWSVKAECFPYIMAKCRSVS